MLVFREFGRKVSNPQPGELGAPAWWEVEAGRVSTSPWKEATAPRGCAEQPSGHPLDSSAHLTALLFDPSSSSIKRIAPLDLD